MDDDLKTIGVGKPSSDPRPIASFLRSGLSANLALARTRLRSPHRGPAPDDDLHRISWVFWLVMGTVAVVQIAVVFDEGSVAWATTLPAWIRDVFEVVTNLGRSEWILVPVGLAILLLLFGNWRQVDRARRAAWAEIAALLSYVFAAVAGAAILTNILKQIIGRTRPIGFGENGWLSFDALNFNYTHASFPSGHATTAGAAMMAGILIFPRLRAPIIFAGIMVALSRVIVGAHFPSDALAGLTIGSAFSYVMARWLLRRRVGFVTVEGRKMRPRVAAIRDAYRRRGIALLAAPFRAIAGGAAEAQTGSKT